VTTAGDVAATAPSETSQGQFGQRLLSSPAFRDACESTMRLAYRQTDQEQAGLARNSQYDEGIPSECNRHAV